MLKHAKLILVLLTQFYNPNFKGVEFDAFLFEAVCNTFTLFLSK